jgi:hypothetical protein
VAKRRGWGCNRFDIRAYTDDASIQMMFPASDDKKPYPLWQMIAGLEDCLSKLRQLPEAAPPSSGDDPEGAAAGEGPLPPAPASGSTGAQGEAPSHETP